MAEGTRDQQEISYSAPSHNLTKGEPTTAITATSGGANASMPSPSGGDSLASGLDSSDTNRKESRGLNLTEEERRARRLKQKRDSAKRSRLRRMDALMSLQEEISQARLALSQLRQHAAHLEEENDRLKAENAQLRVQIAAPPPLGRPMLSGQQQQQQQQQLGQSGMGQIPNMSSLHGNNLAAVRQALLSQAVPNFSGNNNMGSIHNMTNASYQQQRGEEQMMSPRDGSNTGQNHPNGPNNQRQVYSDMQPYPPHQSMMMSSNPSLSGYPGNQYSFHMNPYFGQNNA
ncbi:hypothetical protein GpartN1_g6252.t1 [Galdieria partita]|uniref:BZIP domain-containing protein n=1 Tax=Galdieria partita TaxID=83374 RepID=A0A9C7Q2V6_9RHOD|nr:hypothetical protein GpartN1_g6252.t1 [Galdieria partita]